MKILEESIKDLVNSVFDTKLTEVVITRPESQFGDFASNVALQLSKQLGQPPRDIANELADNFNSSNYDWLESVSVAGPGFINFKLKDNFIFNAFSNEPEQSLKDKIVIAEYSDPNAFKALHAGHLYTTLVGNAIANILEQAGAKVYRLNYGGDVGLHAAKAMYGIVASLNGENPDKLQEIYEADRPTWVSARYVDGNTAYEASDDGKSAIASVNKRIYQLHEQNDTTSDFAQIYWTCRQWSYDGFKKMYDELAVHQFDEYIPESLVTPLGLATVDEGYQKGVFEESSGALIYSEEKSGLHTRVFKTSKGLPTYEAKELGLARYKWEKYHFDKSLVITGNDIVEYMKVLFSAMTHFYPEVEQRTTHLTHGMIKLSGGRKMSSRTGNVLMAADIIDTALQANKAASGKDDKRVAIGAVKYAFLKQRIGGDIAYDPEESISLNGNSGPYIQYAYARAQNVLAKLQNNSDKEFNNVVLDEHERLLAVKLNEYPEVVAKAAADFMPHHICTYLYELAQTFNRFYENNKVVGDQREQLRAELVRRYSSILKAGLNILGIDAIDNM